MTRRCEEDVCGRKEDLDGGGWGISRPQCLNGRKGQPHSSDP